MSITFMKKIIKKNIKKEYLFIFSYVFSALITVLVYLTGGTSKVYANLMYLPISIVASTYGKKHGIIIAVINGFLIGPFMPLNIALKINQDTKNWIVRIIIYCTIAFIIGFFSDYQKKEFEKNREKDILISDAQMATIYSLVKLSESRDGETGAHMERIAKLSELLATKLRNNPKYTDYINDSYIENIYKASLLHDIGKVGISDKILLKPAKLTEEEFDIMKTHTTIGANTLIEVKKKYPNNTFLELGICIANFHHEKWNGTGYPLGLKGDNIPLSARIIALVDVYDALRSKRAYKEALTHEKSLEIIKQGDGVHFDPDIVYVFIKNEKQIKDIFEEF